MRPTLRLALPSGRIFPAVWRLLEEAGLTEDAPERGYRPTLRDPAFEAKLLKAKMIPAMLALGARDLGFCGADWVHESGGGALVELLDTGLDPVRIAVAAPQSLLAGGRLPDRPLIVASEYERYAHAWIAARHLNAVVLPSRGTTEALPPEDCDCIIDNIATGATLAANGLVVVEELARSTTRLYASERVMSDPTRRTMAEDFAAAMRDVLSAALVPRPREIVRITRETDVRASVAFDSTRPTTVDTGLPFLDHMLNAMSFHGRLGLSLTARGDLQVDDHHTVEDSATVLGDALRETLGDRRGVARFGDALIPMDEALARCAIDLSGRPFARVRLGLKRESIGGIATENFTHFFETLAQRAGLCLHLDVLRGKNDHHRIEAGFKAFGRALRAAALSTGETLVPSTKGALA